MKKAIFMTAVALSATVFLLAQDASKFNGTWKGDGGQVRKLTYKDGVIYMEEHQPTGDRIILRNYPTQGQEITMTMEGVWKDAKATGKMEGNKLVVETEQANGAKWHDEWTMAEDGKSYSALRVSVGGGRGGGKGPGGPPPGGGAPPAAGGGPGGGKGPGGGGGRGAPMPETFTKIQ